MIKIATLSFPFLTTSSHQKRANWVVALVFLCTIGAADAAISATTTAQMATKALLLDIQFAGERMVAVGERGHILYSDDQGDSWQLAQVPVRATLTALYFVDADTGWATGHEGVLLKTTDAGLNWKQVLDGPQANQLVIGALETVQDDGTYPDPDSLELMLDDAYSFAEEGASRPFLDIQFLDAQRGFALGAYGLFFATYDGGETWIARPLALDNPDLFHLNQLAVIGDQLYIAGEAGTLFVSDDEGDTWDLLDSPYEGTFFGIAPLGADQVLAFGLRGNAYRLDASGEWHPVDTGTDQSLFGALPLAEGGLLLLGNSGLALTLDTQGAVIAQQQTPSKHALLAALQQPQGRLLLAGSRGIESMEAR